MSKKKKRLTAQEEEDQDIAYQISDKRTTNLIEAHRLVEYEQRYATVDEKFTALGEAVEKLCRLIGTDDALWISSDLMKILDKETAP
jgi:hypothetical protein